MEANYLFRVVKSIKREMNNGQWRLLVAEET